MKKEDEKTSSCALLENQMREAEDDVKQVISSL